MASSRRTLSGLLVTLLLLTALSPVATVQSTPTEASEYYYGVEYDWSSLDSDLENVTGLDVQALFTEIMADADAAGFNLDLGELTTGSSNVYIHQTEDISPQTVQDLDGNDVQVWSRTSDVVLRHGVLSTSVLMTDWEETTFGSDTTSFDIDVVATAENVLTVDIVYTEYLNDDYHLVGADMDLDMTVGMDLGLTVDVTLQGDGETFTVDFDTGAALDYSLDSSDAQWRLGQPSPIYVEAAGNDRTEWRCAWEGEDANVEQYGDQSSVTDQCGEVSGTYAASTNYDLSITGLPTEEFGFDAGEFDLSVSDTLSNTGPYDGDVDMDGMTFSMRTDKPLEVDLGDGAMTDVVACDSCPPGNPVMFALLGNVMGYATMAFGEEISSDLEADFEDSLFALFLETWAGSLAEANTDGNLALYSFGAQDAQGGVGTGSNDNLIWLTMNYGSDINWAAVSVKISVDGGAPVICDNPGVSGSSPCALVEYGNTDDQWWSVGDGVTIVENGQDLCSSDCNIDVTIIDNRENKVIDTTYGYAEGSGGSSSTDFNVNANIDEDTVWMSGTIPSDDLTVDEDEPYFYCEDGSAIWWDSVNDGNYDCDDGDWWDPDYSDEDDGQGTMTHTCHDGTEISFALVNDGKGDCLGYDDEGIGDMYIIKADLTDENGAVIGQLENYTICNDWYLCDHTGGYDSIYSTMEHDIQLPYGEATTCISAALHKIDWGEVQPAMDTDTGCATTDYGPRAWADFDSGDMTLEVYVAAESDDVIDDVTLMGEITDEDGDVIWSKYTSFTGDDGETVSIVDVVDVSDEGDYCLEYSLIEDGENTPFMSEQTCTYAEREIGPSDRLNKIFEAFGDSNIDDVFKAFGENLDDTFETFEEDSETPEFPYVDGMWAPLWSNQKATIVGVGVYAWDDNDDAYVIVGPTTTGYSNDLPMTFASIRYITGVPAQEAQEEMAEFDDLEDIVDVENHDLSELADDLAEAGADTSTLDLGDDDTTGGDNTNDGGNDDTSTAEEIVEDGGLLPFISPLTVLAMVGAAAIAGKRRSENA